MIAAAWARWSNKLVTGESSRFSPPEKTINPPGGSKMLQFLAWINGEGGISHMAEKMIEEEKGKLLPSLNKWLADQLPMGAPTSCGASATSLR